MLGWAEGSDHLPQDVSVPGVLGRAACPTLGHGELLLHNWRGMCVPAALQGSVQVLTPVSFIPQSTSTFLGECD